MFLITVDPQVRVNEFHRTSAIFGERKTVVTLQCAKVEGELEMCGSVVHKIDKIITPTPGNIIELLQGNNDLSK